MPLPIFLGVAAAIAGVTGVGAAIHGGVKMKEANDTIESAQRMQKKSVETIERWNKQAIESMDKVGTAELEILHSFAKFSDIIEKVQNRPEFKGYQKGDVKVPKFDGEDVRQASVGAGVLLGGLGGAALGTAGGFAAAGATTAAVMALGVSSTGTAIASLSGVAATNATLAAIGGGALAAGGGGIALGTTILGATTLGAGLLIGGIIFNVVGGSISNKADEAWSQAKRNKEKAEKICAYLETLDNTANGFYDSLKRVERIYRSYLNRLDSIVNSAGKTDWNNFSAPERDLTENTVLLVGLLYRMCKVQLVIPAEKEGELSKINSVDINKAVSDAEKVIEDCGLTA